MRSFHDRLWRRHPTVKTGDQLTRGERAADHLKAALKPDHHSGPAA